MPHIHYETSGFHNHEAAPQPSAGMLTVSWSELIWAAVTVGRRHWSDVIRYGLYSALEIVYRAAMIQANIRASVQGELVKTDAYLRLDPSEKSAVSYFLGLTLTKVAAYRFFGVPWLLHLDVYADELGLVKVGHFMPDLVGEDNLGRWHVLEAKGRSHGLDNQVILRAKTQTAGLSRICGLEPYLRVASLAYFSGKTLCLHLEDPEEVDKHAIDFHPRGGEDGFLRITTSHL